MSSTMLICSLLTQRVSDNSLYLVHVAYRLQNLTVSDNNIQPISK